MKFSYFPGCTLKTKAKELDAAARLAAETLGVTLEELPEWQCCGAVYPMAKEEIAVRLSSVRALMAARNEGLSLVTLCSACHHVIKRVNHDMLTDEGLRGKTNNYIGAEKPYAGETPVIHYLEMLRDRVGFKELKRRTVNPMEDSAGIPLKVGAYYGCMLLRPSSVMQYDNPENPSILEDFLSAIGAEPVKFPYRNECCGGYLSMEDRNASRKASSNVMASAASHGVKALVTACPLCLYNLNETGSGPQTHENIPVYYFTEFLAAALGLKELRELKELKNPMEGSVACAS
jgi:heterodisulfide reductase subunit B